ncbi:tRNA(Ile)(2)-agmatinylcytidine synthase [Methanobrevibacter sp. TMH8]|uniref:tRNA(Ile)(2)-agmatinylcytidine synthase n=1 Tax=Methanobrevibacter sp. TMH8 TaxID=2848611 RepID=UPI001CCDE45F|nr:tRNA(Ile)(2)-agmatinylcytidine synthase [Methanobrevibacter sp. TMH8]MBZ9569959.1 tRNA(Ile)(2)-agmatinylcytidine synthase [Methanobrevibacter sp. TMH8]
MCTTYLACSIINQLNEEGIVIEGHPRLIRLNPFAKFKTRGNGGISFKIDMGRYSNEKIELAKEIILKNVEELSQLSCENTNPGVVFYKDEITAEMRNYAMKAIYSIISIEEAENFAKRIGAEIHKFKKGRGIIGSIAAISCPLEDYTYELLTYRNKENYGKKRLIDKNSVYEMDQKTLDTFENIDINNEYIAIEPKTPCPILYGIRGESVDGLKLAKNIVKVNEPIENYCIFKTNQHTDMHLQNVSKIEEMEKYGCYIVSGYVKENPHVIEGGHVFFTLADDSGEIEAAAYEPTKEFRNIVKELISGDQVQLFGGIGCGGTFNIEKIRIISLNKKRYFENPICVCGKRMTSAGKNKGFKCKKCGNKLADAEKISIEEERDLIEGNFYETPVSARRHLAKPLCRIDHG